jgi:hypothetical protein
MQELNSFYLQQTEPNKGCFLALREIIKSADTEVIETRKYGMPCFCYKNKMFCYLWSDKKSNEPYLLFVEGNLLDHPQLEAGSRKRMKIFRVNPNEDLQLESLEFLLKSALDLYRNRLIKLR